MLRVRKMRFLFPPSSLNFPVEKIFDKIRPVPDEVRKRPFLNGKLLRVIKRAFQNEPGHRVDVRGSNIASKTHGFKWDGTAPCKRIEDFGCFAAAMKIIRRS